jgi:formylglycine-generating enzyme required for sulfatase activity
MYVVPAGWGLPARFGRFEVRRWVGEGTFAEVYLGYDPRLDREVALKVAKPGTLGTPRRVERFRREARSAAGLSHPHIVSLHEYGADGDQHFLVSEFVRGRTLGAEVAAQGGAGLDLRDAARVARRLAEALGYAHGKGVVHRDVKPDNVMLDESGEPKLMDFGLASRGEPEDGEERLTQVGVAVGTPAYMAPEQARADLTQVGPAADQYALGCTLFELLTGRTPFAGPPNVQLLLHQTQPPPSPRAVRRDVPRDLETICLKCLEKDPRRRYRDCQAVADDLRRFLDGEPISARRPGPVEQAVRWARRHPDRAVGLAAALLVGVGVLVAVDRVQKRERADALVKRLEEADTAGVPRLLDDLAEHRDRVESRVRGLAARPVGTKPGLHGRLALLALRPDEPDRAAELAAYLPVCKPEELLPIRQVLKPRAEAVAPALWAVATDGKATDGRRVRAAGALAGLVRDDPRWADAAPAVAEVATRANPVEAVVWAEALEPARGALLPALADRYTQFQARIESGRLEVAEFAAVASGFDVAASFLARYAADRPADLAELAVRVDARHHALFAEAIQAHRAEVIPLLRAEVAKPAPPESARMAEPGMGLMSAVGAAPLAAALVPDPLYATRIATARRRANAAAVLLTLGEADAAWPLLRFPADGDPTARSYLVERLAGIGADPAVLARRLDVEADVGALRALVLALGDFPPDKVPEGDLGPLTARLLGLYRGHPDPGVHSAVDWLLREKWGRGESVAAVDAELKAAARPAGRDWFVNGQGQTFAVVRGPVEFALGSPPREPGRHDGFAYAEPAHRKQLPRSFAVGTREVTMAEFLRFKPNHYFETHYLSRGTAAGELTWYEAARYCNWLSEAEGIPPDQWCYGPNGRGEFEDGMAVKPGHLSLAGYRLPTEAEWEYAARSGSTVARYFGRPDELLPRYARYFGNSGQRAWPAGQLRPNDLGLFDALGNLREWVGSPNPDPVAEPPSYPLEDVENPGHLRVREDMPRVIRGGASSNIPPFLRSANRDSYRPGSRNSPHGFRLARTLPE